MEFIADVVLYPSIHVNDGENAKGANNYILASKTNINSKTNTKLSKRMVIGSETQAQSRSINSDGKHGYDREDNVNINSNGNINMASDSLNTTNVSVSSKLELDNTNENEFEIIQTQSTYERMYSTKQTKFGLCGLCGIFCELFYDRSEICCKKIMSVCPTCGIIDTWPLTKQFFINKD